MTCYGFSFWWLYSQFLTIIRKTHESILWLSLICGNSPLTSNDLADKWGHFQQSTGAAFCIHHCLSLPSVMESQRSLCLPVREFLLEHWIVPQSLHPRPATTSVEDRDCVYCSWGALMVALQILTPPQHLYPPWLYNQIIMKEAPSLNLFFNQW